VLLVGSRLFVPTNNVNDAFQYTIHDSHGGTNTGWVYVLIESDFGQESPAISATPSNTVVTFFGIPGRDYYVQRDTNSDFVGAGLSNFPTASAPANGEITVSDAFEDVGGPAGVSTAFYRLVAP
jgi:hypothetical protein